MKSIQIEIWLEADIYLWYRNNSIDEDDFLYKINSILEQYMLEVEGRI